MKLTQNPVFLHHYSKFMGILLFVLKYMYISLLLKMIYGFSWPAKIMASLIVNDSISIVLFCHRSHVQVQIPQWAVRWHQDVPILSSHIPLGWIPMRVCQLSVAIIPFMTQMTKLRKAQVFFTNQLAVLFVFCQNETILDPWLKMSY